MRWFTSDLHFNHQNILHLGQGRPFSTIEEHNERIVRNFNNLVGWNDVLYVCGDVALGPWPTGLEYVKRLPGQKFLIPGNHDRVSSLESEKRRERFASDYEDAGFEILSEWETVSIYDEIYKVSHYPYHGDSQDKDRHGNMRPVDDGLPLIHGHTHQNHILSYSNKGTPMISVGVDAHGFRPVSEEEIYDLTQQARGNYLDA